MDDGFVKLWRCSLDSRVWNNDGLWKMWCWCLMRASYKKRWVTIKTGKGETEIEIKPGQFVFGRKTAAKSLKIPASTVRNRMAKLETMGNLATKADTHYSIVTICNWDKYQPDQKEEGQAKGQPEDNQRTGTGQPEDTNKKGKKVEEGKKKPRFNARLFLSERKVDEQHINDFFLNRKEKRLSNTKTAFETIASEAIKAKIDLPTAIKKCCDEGWGGFKASWLNGSQLRNGSGPGIKIDTAEATRAMLDNLERQNG